METKKLINKKLKNEFKRFIVHTPAQRLSRNLRTMLLEFLEWDSMEGAEYRQDLFADLQNLFQLLDAVENEKLPGSNSNDDDT